MVRIAETSSESNRFFSGSVNQHPGISIPKVPETPLQFLVHTDHHDAAENQQETAQHEIADQDDDRRGNPVPPIDQGYNYPVEQRRTPDRNDQPENIRHRRMADDDPIALEQPEHQGRGSCRDQQPDPRERIPINDGTPTGMRHIIPGCENDHHRSDEGQQDIQRKDEPCADISCKQFIDLLLESLFLAHILQK